MANIRKEDLHDNAVLRSFQLFFAKTTAGGIVLIIATIVAMIWANSPWHDFYKYLWKSETIFSVDDLVLFKHPFYYVINDGLMVMFFFVVGLEIKRELLIGELSSPRKAMLPVIAALGGVIGPVIIYMFFNYGEPGAKGWAIPMATDIAFSLGILSLAGSKVPLPLKVFLAALAIVDDLMAVLVIAFFFTAEIHIVALVWGGIFLVAMFVLNRLKVNNAWVYFLFGFLLWYAFLESGVHATVAGVIAAFTIPAKSLLDKDSFFERIQKMWERFKGNMNKNLSHELNELEQDSLDSMNKSIKKMLSPLHRLEHGLHPYVAFIIMPIFALANAGIYFGEFTADMLVNNITLGIAFGLFFGKIGGISLFVWISNKFKLTSLPEGVDFKMIFAVSILCAIGFTMALFIGNLSFPKEPIMEEEAKIGIIMASIAASFIGIFVLNKVIKETGK